MNKNLLNTNTIQDYGDFARQLTEWFPIESEPPMQVRGCCYLQNEYHWHIYLEVTDGIEIYLPLVGWSRDIFEEAAPLVQTNELAQEYSLQPHP